MNRIIKFRAYDKNKKSMVNVTNIENAEERNLELMQFTGLKDKNGKEIYEGDILKPMSGSLFVVDWTHGGFYLRTLSNELGEKVKFQDTGVEIEHFEVIGNIYENPELV